MSTSTSASESPGAADAGAEAPRSRMRLLSPWSVLWLTAVWVLLWGELTAMNVVSGVLVALVVLILFPLPPVQVHLRVRPWPTVVLVARFLFDLVVASVQVAWVAVRPGRPDTGVVMDLRLAGRGQLLQTLTSEMVALVPGTVVVDLDSDARVLTIHALDVQNRQQAEKVRHRIRAQEARVLRAFHPDPASVLDPRRRQEEESLVQTGGEGPR